MRRVMLILTLISGLSALWLPESRAELIWGEIQSLRDNGHTMVIRSYDTYTGQIHDFKVEAPRAGSESEEESLNALDVGDEIIVDAAPKKGTDTWKASFMNLPDKQAS